MESSLEAYHNSNQSANSDSIHYSGHRSWPQRRSDNSSIWIVAFRKTTNATNKRTCIVSFAPQSGMSDRAPILRITEPGIASLLISVLNSFVVDFAARLAVGGTDLSYFIIKQLPILQPKEFLREASKGQTYAEFIIPRVLELTYTSWDLQSFANDLGYNGPPFQWNEKRRFLLQSEIDAALFHLYGVERDDVAYVMDTFPIIKRDDERRYQEYRTKRVILNMYDEMSYGKQRGTTYQTWLNPPPVSLREEIQRISDTL